MNSENYKERRKDLSKSLKINALVTLAVVLGMIFYGSVFVPLAYGKEYLEARNIVFLMIVYYVIFAFSSFFALFLDFQNCSGFRSVFGIVSVMLNLSLNYIMIPRYGAMGAVAATIIAQLVYFSAIILKCFRFFSIISNGNK